MIRNVALSGPAQTRTTVTEVTMATGNDIRALKETQRLRVLGALPGDLGSTLSTHMVAHDHITPDSENPIPSSGLCGLQTHVVCRHRGKIKK